MAMPVRIYAVLCLSAIALLGSPAHAQVDFGASISFSITPQQPGPGEAVRVSVKSSLIELSAGEVSWYVNGSLRPSSQGAQQIEITTGELGSSTRIEAVYTEEGFERASVEAVIRPVQIDLLWESDSYTPPFFEGRALPSAGTTLRMEAIPRFVRTDGSRVPPSAIIFTWRKDGYVMANVSGLGKSSATIESPSLFESSTITVEARSADGLFTAQASAHITAREPVIMLYENSPLFGAMYHRALGSQSAFAEEEVSFVAEPYYADARTARDDKLRYRWRVSGNPIEGDPERPHEITINARGSTGSALVELALSHATNLFLNAEDAWELALNTNTSIFGNPFGGN